MRHEIIVLALVKREKKGEKRTRKKNGAAYTICDHNMMHKIGDVQRWAESYVDGNKSDEEIRMGL